MIGNQAAFSHSHDGHPDGATVRSWFADPVAVEHYARAAASLGLWRSEERLFTTMFKPDDRILDIGCGAGRVALGLAKAGFAAITGVDFCPEMIEEARRLGAAQALAVDFQVADARSLPFADGVFEGAVFAFNGLMQIPGRANRRAALRDIRRVMRMGARFVFTTHDREVGPERAFWERERTRREAGGEGELGDRVMNNPEGRIFMHLPDRAEILGDLEETGWNHEDDRLRRELANEPPEVRDFADECRFWVVRKP